MILATLLAAATAVQNRVDAVAAKANLAGVVLVARGNAVLVEKGYGTIAPKGGLRHDPKARWRLASITKQVTAALILRNLHGEQMSLDAPLTASFPFQDQRALASLGSTTMRQLLTHRSGLANPDDSPPDSAGVPSFYTSTMPEDAYCLSKAAVPGSAFAYNNCDYLLAGRLLISVRGADAIWPKNMTLAKPGEMGVPGYIKGKPEPHYELARFGEAGGLIGTAHTVFDFDRALMTGKLLSPAELAELWKPEGGRSYQALGQWVFPGQLKGCAAPKRIVQRDGEIGGVQTRNYILPDDDLVVVVFTNRSSDDFAFGEIWQGKGFAYDLLSAAACG